MYVIIVRVSLAYQTRTVMLAMNVADNISSSCSLLDILSVDIVSAVAYQNCLDNVACYDMIMAEVKQYD